MFGAANVTVAGGNGSKLAVIVLVVYVLEDVEVAVTDAVYGLSVDEKSPVQFLNLYPSFACACA